MLLTLITQGSRASPAAAGTTGRRYISALVASVGTRFCRPRCPCDTEQQEPRAPLGHSAARAARTASERTAPCIPDRRSAAAQPERVAAQVAVVSVAAGAARRQGAKASGGRSHRRRSRRLVPPRRPHPAGPGTVSSASSRTFASATAYSATSPSWSLCAAATSEGAYWSAAAARAGRSRPSFARPVFAPRPAGGSSAAEEGICLVVAIRATPAGALTLAGRGGGRAQVSVVRREPGPSPAGSSSVRRAVRAAPVASRAWRHGWGARCGAASATPPTGSTRYSPGHGRGAVWPVGGCRVPFLCRPARGTAAELSARLISLWALKENTFV